MSYSFIKYFDRLANIAFINVILLETNSSGVGETFHTAKHFIKDHLPTLRATEYVQNLKLTLGLKYFCKTLKLE